MQWTYFGYLGAIKQQNGAAMSAGRLSTFWDIYFERDLREGKLTESQAQEIVDDLVIKWRIVRFLRAPEYNQLFSGDPVWVTEVVGGMGEDGRTLVTKTVVPHAAHALQPRPGARAEPHGVLVAAPARRLQALRDQGVDRHERDPVRVRRPDAAASGATTARIACCVSAMRVGKQMQFFGARVNLPKTLLYALNGGRDEVSGEQVAPHLAPITGDVLDYDDVMDRLDADDGLARARPTSTRSTSSTTCTTSTPTRRSRWRCTTATCCARWRAASPACRTRPTACRRSSTRKVQAGARRARAHGRLRDRGRVPVLRQQRRPGRRHREDAGVDDDEQDPQVSDATATRCTRSRC